MPAQLQYDVIVVGAGSAGCAVVWQLVQHQIGRILVIEAGPSDRTPIVKAPFGLVWMIGSKTRDWRYQSVAQSALGGRKIAIPRGRMLGGSGSINSMVWFRGRDQDFEDWGVSGWASADVARDFDAVETCLRPARLTGAHPLTEAYGHLVPQNDPNAVPTPDRESAGVFAFNRPGGRRRSAADAFLRPACKSGNVHILTNHTVQRIEFENNTASTVHLDENLSVRAIKGVVLCAGAIGSAEILLRSGLGPQEDLKSAGIAPALDVPSIGQNLQDHPSVGIHYQGDGYGLTWPHIWTWASAPAKWALFGTGPLASPTVEGGAFFNARCSGAEPDIQSHFIPFFLNWTGQKYGLGSGAFADACLCRPKSRGALKLGRAGLEIDLNILSHPDDLDSLTAGWLKLRSLIEACAPLMSHLTEAFPNASVRSEEAARAHILSHCGTAYHPVGTLRMGADASAPVSPRLQVKGVQNLWVADASVMPKLTSANTNAPSMMIGYRGGRMIAEDVA